MLKTEALCLVILITRIPQILCDHGMAELKYDFILLFIISIPNYVKRMTCLCKPCPLHSMPESCTNCALSLTIDVHCIIYSTSIFIKTVFAFV